MKVLADGSVAVVRVGSPEHPDAALGLRSGRAERSRASRLEVELQAQVAPCTRRVRQELCDADDADVAIGSNGTRAVEGIATSLPS